MDIQRYKIVEDNNGYTLELYIGGFQEEFASEFNQQVDTKKNLLIEARRIAKEYYPNLKINTVKVLAGMMLISVMSLGNLENVEASPMSSSTFQVTTGYPIVSHTVKSGEALSLISRQYTVTVGDIKNFNNLQSDMIYAGQKLQIPLYSYIVVSGDSLFGIAKKLNTNVAAIKDTNKLTSDLLFIGQKLLIPISKTTVEIAPTLSQSPTQEVTESKVETGTYIVKSGDSLSVISKQYDTTVQDIQRINGLTTSMIYPGQLLRVPTHMPIIPTDPIPQIPPPANEQQIFYTVVAGDSLSVIAKKHSVSVDSIKKGNNLTTDLIHIGQQLKIPTKIDTINQPKTDAQLTNSTGEKSAPSEIPNDTNKIVYTVVSGDSLSVIAKRFHTTLPEIIRINQLNSDMIFAGQRLNIPISSIVVDKTPPKSPEVNSLEVVHQKNVEAYMITGNADPHAKVEITAKDETNQEIAQVVTADENGVFKLNQGFTTLKDGQLSIVATAINEAGLTSIETKVTITKDTVGPHAPSVNVPGFINSANSHRIPVSGQTEPGATVLLTMTDNTNIINKEVTANHAGFFEVIVDGRILTEGPISVQVKSTDTKGNEGESITVQSTKDISVGDLVMSELPVINTSVAGDYRVKGRGEPNTSIHISLSDKEGKTIQNTVQSDDLGNFEATINTVVLQDGMITLLAHQSDQAGNQSQVLTKLLKKDTTAPEAVVINPLVPLHQQNSSNYSFTGQGERLSKVIATFRDNVGNEITQETIVREDGTFSIETDLTGLSGDVLTITAIQVDEVGNVSIIATQSSSIDLVGPQKLDLKFAPIINMETENDYTITGISEPLAHIGLELTDGKTTIIQTARANEEGGFTISTDVSRLDDGKISGQILTKDIYKNKGITKEISVVKDTFVTNITTLEVGDMGRVTSYNVDTYSIGGSSLEDGAIVTVEITDGARTIKETALVVDGRFRIPLNLRELSEGTLQVSVTQQDIAGNKSKSITESIQKDTEVSETVIEISKLTKTATGYVYNIQGIGEIQGKVVVQLSGQSSSDTITKSYNLNISDTFHSTIDITALNGQKPFITVHQVDLFGNKSNKQIVGISSYVVGSGDTLWKISTLLGTSVQELKALNQLASDTVYIGQELKVPIVAGLSQMAISERQAFNMGYLYHGSSNAFMETMNHTQGSINVVAPTYFDLNTDGSLHLTKVLDRHFIASMQSNGVRVVPFLSNHWDRALGEKALDNREILTDQIAEAVRVYNLDGVNIDIENVTHEYQDKYSEFAKILREKIPVDKEVSVAVAANPRGYTLGWHGSYDYKNLAASSDYLMIMAYDESFTGSEPGPVASINFVEKSIQYALENGVSKDKIVLGMGHFGRYWLEGASVGGQGISNEQVGQAVKMYNGIVTFDEESKSPKANFTIHLGDPKLYVYGKKLEPGNYTVWFENEESMKAKFELVEKYGLKGTGNWGLEQENPEFWNAFSGWLQPIKATSTDSVK